MTTRFAMKPIQFRRAAFALTAALLASTLLFAPPASSQSTPSAQEPSASHEIDRLLAEVVSESNTSVALAKAVAVERFRPYVPAQVYIQQLTDAAKKVNSPLVSFRLLRAAEFARLDSRDFSHGKDAMSGPMGEMGCSTDWSIVGPFDNPSM